MVRLTELRIGKYRGTRPGTVLKFNDGFNVLLGTNGSGKTTLLNLIVAVLRADLSLIRDIPFELGWSLQSDELRIEVNVSRGDDLDVDVGKEANGVALDPASIHKAWRFRLDLRQGQQTAWYEADSSGNCGSSDLNLSSKHYSPFEGNTVLMLVQWLRIEWATKGATVSLHRLMSRSGRFDEQLGGYRLLQGAERETGNSPGDASLVRHPSGWKWSFVPNELILDAVETKFERPHFESDNSPVLAEFAERLGLEGIRLRGRFLRSETDKDGTTKHYRGFEIQLNVGNGVVISSDEASFGQKRALSFLYYVAASEIVVADELVNGLHWEWIQECLDAIGDKQAFLTSQNPILLDNTPVSSAEDVQQTFIRCTEHWSDGRREWRWEHLSDEQSTEVWESFQLGLRQLGEVLRGHGLW